MTRRSFSLAGSILVTGLVILSACGADVDSVKDATGSESTTTVAVDDRTSTTSGSDTTRPGTTTGKDRSGTPSPDAGPYAEAMAASLLGDEDFPATEQQAKCYADKSIEIIGVDRLKEHDVTPDDLRDNDSLDLSDAGLTMAQGNALYDAFAECDIDLRGLILESMSQDEELTPEMRSCLDQVLSDDNLRKLMVTTMVKGDDAVDADPALEDITNGLMGCLFMAMGSEGSTP